MPSALTPSTRHSASPRLAGGSRARRGQLLNLEPGQPPLPKTQLGVIGPDEAAAPLTAERNDLFQKPAGRDLHRRREPAECRDLRVAFAGLDPADLGGVDAAATGDVFLGQAESPACLAQVRAEVARAGVPWLETVGAHRALHKFAGYLR